ncbi:hypothetical protein [Zunongwangia atlantica]|uniref:Uncharacterized protein n=1 Tax=Zunongwangia atlantica 22II14-10F7 TaxID=1185767 RepID=A0A1Y1T6W0_9FLAO|nr:hypothetical protein [Zunongwangia atlantica]ORL46778.1 hypothetical protein IIF7_04641 [Zunongwangia atlantica 22II14-10F7]
MKNDASNETYVEYRVANFILANHLTYQKNKRGKLLSDKQLNCRSFKAKFLKLKKSKVPKHAISSTPIVFTCGYKVIKNTSYILN